MVGNGGSGGEEDMEGGGQEKRGRGVQGGRGGKGGTSSSHGDVETTVGWNKAMLEEVLSLR